MRKLTLYTLTTICIFVAFLLPANLAKHEEAGQLVHKATHLETISARPIQEAGELTAVEVKPVIQAPTPAPVASAPETNCGSDPYMAYIYQHESGCRTDAVNWLGCTGIGQSCPASKIAHCGTDFACQDAWFRNYAISRYGSTYQAYLTWTSQHWW